MQVPVEIGKLPVIELFNIEENKACKAPPPEVDTRHGPVPAVQGHGVFMCVTRRAASGDCQGIGHGASLLPRFSQGGSPRVEVERRHTAPGHAGRSHLFPVALGTAVE